MKREMMNQINRIERNVLVSGAAGTVSEGQPCLCRDGELGGGTFSEAGLRPGGAVLAVRKDEQHGLCRLSRAQHSGYYNAV